MRNRGWAVVAATVAALCSPSLLAGCSGAAHASELAAGGRDRSVTLTGIQAYADVTDETGLAWVPSPTEPQAKDESEESQAGEEETASEAVPDPSDGQQDEPSDGTDADAGHGSLAALLDSAYSIGPTRKDWGCSGWVYVVFDDAGISGFSGSAADFYDAWCDSDDIDAIRPGMVVAVSTHTLTSAGRTYGHVGIYVGDGMVRHYSAGAIREMPLDEWIDTYGTTVAPMWGWVDDIALS